MTITTMTATTMGRRVGRPLAVAAATAALLATSACGDDAEPLTKSEFTSQADAICAEANLEAEPLWSDFWAGFEGEEPGDDGAEQMFARFDTLLDDLAPITEQQIEHLRALEPPADDKDLVEGLIDDFEAGLEEMNDIADRAVEGDEQARDAMTTEEGDPLAAVNEAARDYGLVVCGAEE